MIEEFSKAPKGAKDKLNQMIQTTNLLDQRVGNDSMQRKNFDQIRNDKRQIWRGRVDSTISGKDTFEGRMFVADGTHTIGIEGTGEPFIILCPSSEVGNVVVGANFLAVKKFIGGDESLWFCIGIYDSTIMSSASSASDDSGDSEDSESSRFPSYTSQSDESSDLEQSSDSSAEQSSRSEDSDSSESVATESSESDSQASDSSESEASDSSESGDSDSSKSDDSDKSESSDSSKSKESDSSESADDSSSSSRTKDSDSSESADDSSSSSRTAESDSSESADDSSSSSRTAESDSSESADDSSSSSRKSDSESSKSADSSSSDLTASSASSRASSSSSSSSAATDPSSHSSAVSESSSSSTGKYEPTGDITITVSGVGSCGGDPCAGEEEECPDCTFVNGTWTLTWNGSEYNHSSSGQYPDVPWGQFNVKLGPGNGYINIGMGCYDTNAAAFSHSVTGGDVHRGGTYSNDEDCIPDDCRQRGSGGTVYIHR